MKTTTTIIKSDMWAVLYAYFFYIFTRITYLFGKPINSTPRIQTMQERTDKYIKQQKTGFLNTYSQPDTFNTSITDILYSVDKTKELFLDETHPLEKEWKTRILFENTPHGNIIMYYDIFK